MIEHQMLLIIKSNLGFPNPTFDETFGFAATKMYLVIWGQMPLTTLSIERVVIREVLQDSENEYLRALLPDLSPSSTNYQFYNLVL